MSYNAAPEGSVVLRLEFSIADAVHQRGLLSVISQAIRAWWTRPRPSRIQPACISARLRADIGLPPENECFDGVLPIIKPSGSDPLWRPGM